MSVDTVAPGLRVGVLFGGRSGEHEVSLQSARAVIDGLLSAGHDVVPIGITRQGRWLLGGDTLAALTLGTGRGEYSVAMLPEPGGRNLVRHPEVPQPALAPLLPSLDVVFPLLHGTYGEDGTVQGLLELAGVPYVGSGILGSSVGMDKVFQKTYWRAIGLPIVSFVPVQRAELEQDERAVLDRVESELTYPVFSKPANLGSSVGVHKARNRIELERGLRDAARYDEQLLVEQGLDARELECAVLGNAQVEASVVGEIVPNADFYSYRAKYLDQGAEPIIPARIDPPVADRVRSLAVQAFQSIRGAGLARVDFFLERSTGRVYLNEVNTMPGFTQISMYPKLWEASGVSFPSLVDKLVRLAVERATERARNQTSYDAARE